MKHDPLTRLLDHVSGSELMRHCTAFARWTKHAGTPEERESLAYVREQLDGYGYATELLDHDAYISLPGAASVEALGETHRAITHSFSRPSGPEGTRAEVEYVGTGTDEDFASRDVVGKIVLVTGIANPAVSLRASRAGAVGQIHVSPHEHLHEMCISSVWGSPTHETVGRLPSTVVVTVSAEAGERLMAAVADGVVEATLKAEVDTGWRTTPILVAELPAPNGGNDDPYVLFTGHHDTWYYGVMDNGGANATMLEVARLCAQERDAWERGLRIVFWSGHSQGRYSSSTWYADAHFADLEARAVAHVNVDSTGGKGNTVVADTTAAAELAPLAREALTAQADQTFSGRRMQRAGDQSFWGIGVPSIFGNMSEQPAGGETNASAAVFGGGARLGHGTGWWWHTPDDTLDKMDEAILVRDTRIYLHVVWRLLTDSVLPLDYAEHTRALHEHLQELRPYAEPHVDLAPVVTRAKKVAAKADQLEARRAQAGAEEADALNHCLLALGRALVPIDYVAGDVFEQDPALSQGPLPSLQPVRRFEKLEAESDEAKFLTVGMMRARNRIDRALRQAEAALDAFLTEREAKT